MTRVALRICIRIYGCFMAISAFGAGMALNKRKKIMIESCPGPLKRVYRMTRRTILRKPGISMIWICC
jgi:hypothetical protein